MKIKLDENLPERLASELKQLGHDIDTVPGEHLVGQTDEQVWQAAQSASRFLITQDLDFSDMRLYTPGTHAGLLLVRLASPKTWLAIRTSLAEPVVTLAATGKS